MNTDTNEVDKSIALITVEIIEYLAQSVVNKPILNKTTGNVNVISFDNGEGLPEKITPFDTYTQIVEGKAEIVIDTISHLIKTGQSIVIPAHSSSCIKPNGRFKMIQTVIKSGYE